MKKALIALAVPILTLLVAAGPASAAPLQVSHYHFNGNFAETVLSGSTATSETSTYLRVSQSTRESSLVVEQVTLNYDAQHNFAGATATTAEVTSGFSFSIDSAKLTTAATAASGLPQLHLRRELRTDRLRPGYHQRDRGLDRRGPGYP